MSAHWQYLYNLAKIQLTLAATFGMISKINQQPSVHLDVALFDSRNSSVISATGNWIRTVVDVVVFISVCLHSHHSHTNVVTTTLYVLYCL